MPKPGINGLASRCVKLPGYFVCEVTDEHLHSLGGGVELRVGWRTWKLDMTVLSPDDISPVVSVGSRERTAHFPEKPRMFVESTRIGIACVHESRV